MNYKSFPKKLGLAKIAREDLQSISISGSDDYKEHISYYFTSKNEDDINGTHPCRLVIRSRYHKFRDIAGKNHNPNLGLDINDKDVSIVRNSNKKDLPNNFTLSIGTTYDSIFGLKTYDEVIHTSGSLKLIYDIIERLNPYLQIQERLLKGKSISAKEKKALRSYYKMNKDLFGHHIDMVLLHREKLAIAHEIIKFNTGRYESKVLDPLGVDTKDIFKGIQLKTDGVDNQIVCNRDGSKLSKKQEICLEYLVKINRDKTKKNEKVVDTGIKVKSNTSIGIRTK